MHYSVKEPYLDVVRNFAVKPDYKTNESLLTAFIISFIPNK